MSKTLQIQCTPKEGEKEKIQAWYKEHNVSMAEVALNAVRAKIVLDYEWNDIVCHILKHHQITEDMIIGCIKRFASMSDAGITGADAGEALRRELIRINELEKEN